MQASNNFYMFEELVLLRFFFWFISWFKSNLLLTGAASILPDTHTYAHTHTRLRQPKQMSVMASYCRVTQHGLFTVQPHAYTLPCSKCHQHTHTGSSFTQPGFIQLCIKFLGRLTNVYSKFVAVRMLLRMHIHSALTDLNVVYIFLSSHLFMSNVNTIMNFPSLCRVWVYCCSAAVCCFSDLEKSGFSYFLGLPFPAFMKISNLKERDVLICSLLNLLTQHFRIFCQSSASLRLAAESFTLGL